MLRWFVIAVVLSACAEKKAGAPAAVESQPTAPAAPNAQAPTPGPGQGDGQSRAEAMEAARNGAILGPTAETHSFDPIEAGDPSGSGPKVGGTGGGGGDAPKGPKPKTGTATNDTPPVTVASPDSSRRGGVVALFAKVGDVMVGGKPAPATLTKALVLRVSDVQACYDKAATKPTTAVGVTIAFTVAANGQLSSVSLERSTLANAELEGCIVGVIQKIKLATPLGADEVRGTMRVSFGPNRT